MKWNTTIRKLLALALSLTLTLSLTTAAFATDGGGQSQTCNGTLGCKDGTHVEGCPEYKAPDSQTPVCTKDDSCTLTGDHDPSCPKYVVPCTKDALSNLSATDNGNGNPAEDGNAGNPPDNSGNSSGNEKQDEVTKDEEKKDEQVTPPPADPTPAPNPTPAPDPTPEQKAAELIGKLPADVTKDNVADVEKLLTEIAAYEDILTPEQKALRDAAKAAVEKAKTPPAPTPAEKLQQMIDALPAALAKLNPETDQEAAHNEVQKIYDFAANNGLELTVEQEEAIFRVFEAFYPRDPRDTKAVAKIDNTEYSTLQEAFEKANNNATVELIDNITDMTTDMIATVPAGKALTLNMAGKSITVKSGTNAQGDLNFQGRPIVNNGTLTITGNGTIDSTASQFGGYGAVNNFGTLTIENGTYKGHIHADGAAVFVRPGSEATINGGLFEGTAAINSSGKLTINNGTFQTTSCNRTYDTNGKNHWAYCVISGGELYFNNGTVTGVQGALAINSGYAEVKNGIFKTVACGHTTNGDASHYALYVAGERGKVEAHISGGDYTAASKVAVQVGNDNTGGDGGINAKATAYISGGTFTGGTDGSGNKAKAIDAGTNTGNPNITGGTFSSDVRTYVPDGYFIKDTSGKCVVGKDTTPADEHVAEVNGQYFKELKNAIAVANGAEVKLLKDATGETVTVPAGSTVTLDLNGKTYTTSGATVVNKGVLTVKDTSDPSTGKLVSTGSFCIAVGNDSTTTFASGTIESVEGAIITGVSTGATIDVTGGTLSASDNAVIAGNGTSREGTPNTINISGGTLNGAITTSGYVACGVYAPWKDNVNITGGTINVAGGAGVVARAGNVNISGGTITTSGNATGKVGDSRVVVPCSAIVYDSEAAYPAMTEDSKIAVTGGKFTSASGVAAITNVGDNVKIEVSNGTFSTPVDEKYCATGFVQNEIKNANGKVIGYGVHQHQAAAQLQNVKPATCKEEGYTGDTVCSICGKVMTPGTKIDKTEHKYGDWVYHVDDCTKDGTRTQTCSVCGDVKSEPITAGNHPYSKDWSSNEAGHWHDCTICDDKTPLEAHKFEWITVSRDASGSKMQRCSICGYVAETDWSKLELTVKANRSTVRPGKTITYTLTVTNKTGKDMDKVYVSGDLGKNLTFTKATGTGEYDKKNDLWIISDLKDGKSVKLTLKVTVKSGVKDGTKLEYTADIIDAEAYNGETYPDCSLARSTVTVKVSNKFSLIPETGDTSNIAIWITVLVVAALALIAAVVVFIIKSRKKK